MLAFLSTTVFLTGIKVQLRLSLYYYRTLTAVNTGCQGNSTFIIVGHNNNRIHNYTRPVRV